MKSVRIWSFPGPCFPAFGLNTELYLVPISPYSLRMRKIRTRKTPNTDTFQAVRPCKTCQNYHSNETNLYVYKFDNRILKTADKITKISRALKYELYTETSFFAFEKILSYISEALVLSSYAGFSYKRSVVLQNTSGRLPLIKSKSTTQL